MCNFALTPNKKLQVVSDQVGQPTSAEDLAKQIIYLINSNASRGIYHGTNSGQASWFEFAKEIFKLIGADENRILEASSKSLKRAAVRPTYSVLSHESWIKADLNPMQDWKTALNSALPKILNSLKI